MADSQEFTQQLAALAVSYRAALPDKLAELDASCQRALHAQDAEAIVLAYRQAHSLAGSGATFGFETVGNAARKLEHVLKAASGRNPPTLNGDGQLLEVALATLRQAVDTATPVAIEGHATPVSESTPETALTASIHVLEDDPALAEDWITQLQHLGYSARHFSTIAALEAELAVHPPLAIVADENLPDGRASAFLMQRRTHDTPTPPVFVVSGDGGFDTRLAAVRAGARSFFTKPLDVAALAQQLAIATNPDQSDAPRILMVEDDAEMAAWQALLLRNAGMHVETVPDPLTLMQHIGGNVPDLVLMDMHMPGCTGVELASVLRQQDAYAGIPIVFLSGETDLTRQMEALDIGGDDFLTKPVDPRRLVAAVAARVKRARAVRALMTHDSLTGLLNHTTVKDALEREVAQAHRTGAALCVAVIDIDHFKQVNDRHGHQAGDRVLKTLAQLLQLRLRRSDVIGRYGGEEFIVVLPNTGMDIAVEVLDRLRAGFGNIEHRAGGNAFQVTFSVGVASYPDHARASATLIKTADQALYAAKHNGRNRIVRATP